MKRRNSVAGRVRTREGQGYLVAVDPGAAGGFAWTDTAGTVHAEKMPDGMTAQIDRLRDLAEGLPGCRVVMERVGVMPHDGAASAAKFSRHCGHLEAALYCLAVPVEQVAPGTWQRALGALPKEKAERKRAIREDMQRRHPHLRVTLATADALGILLWAGRRAEG